MPDIYLVCEGPADGLDVRVLNSIIAQKLGKNVIITPAGGDTSLGSVATWLEERSRKTRRDGTLGPAIDRAYSVEDRNYRSWQEAATSWLAEQGKRFIWHRHEIENYLLDSRVVARAFESLRLVTRWPADLPRTATEAETLLQQLAQPMIEDHVGWVVYWKLVSIKRGAVDIRLKWPMPPLQPPGGSRYPGRTEWLSYLIAECSRAKRDCESFAQMSEFDERQVTTLYDQVLAETTQPDFLVTGQYLVDMGGHELISALLQHLNRQGVSHLSLPDLETELLDSLVQQYQPGFFVPDDFFQLAARLI